MKQIALTLDDLPRHEFTSRHYSPYQIVFCILEALASNELNSVYGFVNGAHFEQNPQDLEIAKLWLQFGNRLGNHTYRHLNAGKVGVQDFIGDIQQNDLLLQKLGYFNQKKFFRYPYLMEGADAEGARLIKSFLSENAYQIAEVTIDYLDFAWDQPVEACLSARRGDLLEDLKRLQIETALIKANNAYQAAQEVFGRPIKHILLIHCCLSTALFLDEVLKALKADGWSFISLPEAVKDEAYEQEIDLIQADGPNFLMKHVAKKQLDLPNNKPCVPFHKIRQVEMRIQ